MAGSTGVKSQYERMYLISEEEWNMKGYQNVKLPVYKTPEQKDEERDFKALGNLENKAKQLYAEVLKHSRVNDKNEWFERRDDTLAVSGSNIVDLITYTIKASGKPPLGWIVFSEFLKRIKTIPKTLMIKKIRTEIESASLSSLLRRRHVSLHRSFTLPGAGLPSSTQS